MFDPTQCESVSMAQAKAQEEQNPVNAALRATSIAFVTLAEAGQIDDTTATENVSQFAPLDLSCGVCCRQYPPV